MFDYFYQCLNMKKNTTVSYELIKILCEGSCEGEESFGNCPYRRNGRCSVIQNLHMCQVNQLANAILASGWIRLPCKVGDTVYMPWKWNETIGIASLEVTHIIIDGLHAYIRTYFETDDQEYYDAYSQGK